MKVFTTQHSVMTVVIAPTVKLIDMISNFGGTLGLFSGISILSIIEIIYWTFKGLARRLMPGSKKSKVLKVQLVTFVQMNSFYCIGFLTL